MTNQNDGKIEPLRKLLQGGECLPYLLVGVCVRLKKGHERVDDHEFRHDLGGLLLDQVKIGRNVDAALNSPQCEPGLPQPP